MKPMKLPHDYSSKAWIDQNLECGRCLRTIWFNPFISDMKTFFPRLVINPSSSNWDSCLTACSEVVPAVSAIS